MNCYVLTEGSLTLIDPGPGTEEAFGTVSRGLEELGYGVDDVERVLITHPHIDHFGLTSRIESVSGATVSVHHDGISRLEQFRRHYAKQREFFEGFLVEMGMPPETARSVTELPESYAKLGPPVDVDVPLSPGDELDVGFTLECLESAGHTSGSLSFLLPQQGAAFTGDHVLAEITPNPTLEAPDEGGSRPRSLVQYLSALRAMRDVDATVGYGGHGPIISDLDARIREIIAHHRERKGEFLEHVGERPKTAFELMQAVFPDLPPDQYFTGMSETVGHLDLLEADGSIERRSDDRVVRFVRSSE